MAPKTPKKATANTNAKKNTTAGQPAIDYAEAQADEALVLASMYMDDYEEVEHKGAWGTAKDRSFKLTLRSTDDEESTVTITGQLSATYPKALPVLGIEGLERYLALDQKRLRDIVKNRPKDFAGEVMIVAIVEEVQEALNAAVAAREQARHLNEQNTLPSLDYERADAKETARILAQEAQEAQEREQLEAKKKNESSMQRSVRLELDRRERRKAAMSSEEDTIRIPTGFEEIAFDQPATLQIANEDFRFNKVVVVSSVSQSRDLEMLLAKPQTIGHNAPPLVAVKRSKLSKDRNEILQLETILASIQKLRHFGLLGVLAYRIDRLDDLKSESIFCREYADRVSLADVLQLGNVNGRKARQFTITILEALEYLHSNGVAHGNLNDKSIFLVGNPSAFPKLADFGLSAILKTPDDKRIRWPSPEVGSTSFAEQSKSDIWQFGEVVCQLFLGTDVVAEYNSAKAMMDSLNLSASFEEILHKIFTVDAQKRPSAFDLLTAECWRTDDPVVDDAAIAPSTRSETSRTNGACLASRAKRNSRHNSSGVLEPLSRYANDFTEMGRLGKGGFGEVVKARNKLDGGIYAIKKIRQAPHLLDQVISEVMLLNRLNHPYVVRYFSTWVEEDASGAVLEDSTNETETETTNDVNPEEPSSDGPRIDFGYQSTGGLDFVSSSGYPIVEFGADSDSESSEEDDEQENDGEQNGDAAIASAEPSGDNLVHLRKSRSDSRRAPSTLYIQMEYCERHTLRDLVRKTMSADNCWRYVRQITEGLAHIHGHGIIHRDLKPDNVFIDVTGNSKIGDFGLATTAQQQFVDKAATMSGHSAGEMTRSVGTALYVAPELRSTSGTSYNNKVDMYSLGIIFYEMCEPFSTGMERYTALQRLREKDHELPHAYRSGGEKAAQGRLIMNLVSHKPSERMSSTALLRSDMLPLEMEDEIIQQALSSLSDAKSPYHQKMMSAIFAHDSPITLRIKGLAWDANSFGPSEDANRLRLRNIARQTLETIFRRHGAEESRRQSIFPKSEYYANAKVMQVLDASGSLLQLPYDLTLPHARQLARQNAELRCTFAFGNAYRDNFDGGPPKVSEEVDFDISDNLTSDKDLVDDAEVMKVVDEIVQEMPLFASSATTSFHLNHSVILDAILEFCRIPVVKWPSVKEIISRLGFHQYTWSKVRSELRQFGLPDTTLDDLQQFNFRDVPEKAFARLDGIFENSNRQLRDKLRQGIQAVGDVVRRLMQFGFRQKLYITPCGSVNAKFYEDGMLFQCVLERKSNRVVIAAGGRYDSLIRWYRPTDTQARPQGAVGVSIGLDPIISHMVKTSETTSKRKFLKRQSIEQATAKRCSVLILATTESVQPIGIKLLTALWESEISAELANKQKARNKDYSFVVTVRHEASNLVKVLNTETEGEEVDVTITGLLSYLQAELRERESSKLRQPALLRQSSQQEQERKSNVHVLLARHGSKKSNKYQIVSDAQEQWSRKLQGARDAPILAIETRDDVLDLVQQTRLSDAESWRKAVQSVQLNDRQYVQQIHDMLASWRKSWEDDDGMREACVFNFRTQSCIYYDLGL